MKYKDYLKSFDGKLFENNALRITLVLAVAAVLVLIVMLFGKTERVVLQPVTLQEQAWVEDERSSASYQKSWGAYLGLLVGNVTPEKIDFVREQLIPVLSPTIRAQAIRAFEEQARELQEAGTGMRFELRGTKYEPDTGKVFAYGDRYEGDVFSDDVEITERTYEFEIRVREYMPEVMHIDTYSGEPRTRSVLREMERNQ